MMKALSEHDPEYQEYRNTLADYIEGYEAMGAIIWILVDSNKPVAIIAVGQEPLMLLEPIGTPVSVVNVLDYELSEESLTDFAMLARNISRDANVVYSFIDIPDKYRKVISSFESVGYCEEAHSLRMKYEIVKKFEVSEDLSYEKVERENVDRFLTLMIEAMSGASDNILEMILKNIQGAPNQILDYWYGTEILYLIYHGSDIVGVLDLSPQSGVNIANMGVMQKFRGQGYGREILRFALLTLRELGIAQAGLRVHVDNKTGIRLYESIGFERSNSYHALIWRE
ncbi:MAG: GNAT family N-acetyltransferase [Candidatus Thorarchaeota archaeon]